MSILTLKEYLTNKISLIPDSQKLKNSKIKLVTSAGLISGTLAINEPTRPGYSIIDTTIDGFIEEYYSKYISASETDISEKNDSILRLQDVTITNGTAMIQLSYLIVFIDHITGITIGE